MRTVKEEAELRLDEMDFEGATLGYENEDKKEPRSIQF